MSHPKRLRIGVLGPHQSSPDELACGTEVGRLLGRAGVLLVCGGLDGMMEAAARGAHETGGMTIGILPGDSDSAANAFIDIPIPTGLGTFRNALLVRTCHAVIAIGGAYGTLSEIAFALRLEVPVVGINTWACCRGGEADPGIHAVDDPEAAVEKAIELACRRVG